MEQVHCVSLLEALTRAVREVSPLAVCAGIDAITAELEVRICGYWRKDHGMTAAELIATAWDVKANAIAGING